MSIPIYKRTSSGLILIEILSQPRLQNSTTIKIEINPQIKPIRESMTFRGNWWLDRQQLTMYRPTRSWKAYRKTQFK